MPEVGNPTELPAALSFGAMYALVLLLAAWLQDLAGSQGLYLVALVSGLTDVDAITLTTLRLYDLQKLSTAQAATSISLALLANLGFKAGLVLAIGGPGLARRALPGFAAVALAVAAALLLLY